MSLSSRRRRAAAAVATMTCLLAAAAPAFAASTATETLSNFKIAGTPSAKAGRVTFKVRNAVATPHELVVIRTTKRAGKLTVKGGKAVMTGKVGEVEFTGKGTKTLRLTLTKGHYALICNFGGHYMAGMHKDFTVR